MGFFRLDFADLSTREALAEGHTLERTLLRSSRLAAALAGVDTCRRELAELRASATAAASTLDAPGALSSSGSGSGSEAGDALSWDARDALLERAARRLGGGQALATGRALAARIAADAQRAWQPVEREAFKVHRAHRRFVVATLATLGFAPLLGGYQLMARRQRKFAARAHAAIDAVRAVLDEWNARDLAARGVFLRLVHARSAVAEPSRHDSVRFVPERMLVQIEVFTGAEFHAFTAAADAVDAPAVPAKRTAALMRELTRERDVRAEFLAQRALLCPPPAPKTRRRTRHAVLRGRRSRRTYDAYALQRVPTADEANEPVAL